jgi:hypothetical protein
MGRHAKEAVSQSASPPGTGLGAAGHCASLLAQAAAGRGFPQYPAFCESICRDERPNGRMKRARTPDQQAGVGAGSDLPGRDQILLTSPEMQTRLGRKFVDETELLPLLLAHGLVRRVRTIQIEVRPLGGDSFKVILNASKPTVGEAKAEVARSQGTAESRVTRCAAT